MFKKLIALNYQVLKAIVGMLFTGKIKELIKIFPNLIKSYVIETVKVFKMFPLYFKPKYYIALSNARKYRKAKKIMTERYRGLKDLSIFLDEQGYSRAQQRLFWSSFVKDGSVRKNVLESLLKDLESRKKL